MPLTTVGTSMISSGGGNVATNTALGNSALAANTTGSFNDAFGSNAAASNTTGTNLSAFGAYTLNKNTTGIVNSAFGGSNTIPALYNNTTGSYNCAFGTGALFSNTTASNNTSVGYQAGYSNTTGFGNVLMGNFAGYSSVTANYQTAFGYGSLQTATGGSNTGLGVFALNAVTTGTNNTGVGPSAGSALTSGSNNTYVGGFSGNGNGLDLRTRSYNVGLSMGNGSLRYLSLDMGTVSTSAVDISPSVGIGGLHFVTAYNLSGGAQGWWLIATRVNSVTIIASSNGTGLTINFGQSGSVRLTMATTSGSVAGNCHSWVDA